MRRRHAPNAGQATLETGLTLSLFLVLLFGAVDIGRYVYVRNIVAHAADAAAHRLATRVPQVSDCEAQNAAVTSGSGVSITVDPKSISGNARPDVAGATSIPPAGTGYVYLYPAVATAATCNPNAVRPSVPQVWASVSYSFRFVTPFLSATTATVTITGSSAVAPEY